MPQDGPRELTDSDYTAVSAALARSHGLNFSTQQVSAAIQSVAEENAYHPIRDYLNGLEWDGVKRIEHWLHDFLGAEDSEYTAGIGRMFLIGVVARVMKPGCKMDYVLIFEGNQGIRKSTACKVLAGEKFFSDSLPPIREGSKDLASHLAGKWLVEVAEMSAASRADTEALKAFLGSFAGGGEILR
ncbi:VapE domain-containing protein [Acetobacter ascendens]|nr:VapE domain-containing protein [Acetobacter ascendens]